MPAAAIIGLSAFALLSGPICGGIHWHRANRDRCRDFWARRLTPELESKAADKVDGATA
jgi:hypothetical protein